MLADGVQNHADALRRTSRLIIGESAGSIVLGGSLDPARIPPADIVPDIPEAPPLGIVNMAVAVHMPNAAAERRFDIGGFVGWAGRSVMRGVQSSPGMVESYVAESRGDVAGLHDALAAHVQGGNLVYIRS